MSSTNVNRDAWRFVEQNTQKLFGPTTLELEPNDVIVVVRVRNSKPYLAPFFNHYLKLGVKHFFLIDNNSADDTAELAKQWKQVTIFQTQLPYKQYKMDFFHFLLNRFGTKCWSLVVDIDEFFDYPFSDFISLDDLVRYLDKYQFQAVVGQMLDMFPEDLSFDNSTVSDNFIRDHIYYDLSDISKHLYHESIQQNEWTNYNIFLHRGGIRKSIFGLSDIILTKFSLIRYSPDWSWESIHCLSGVKVADFSAVLYHYKFRSEFITFVKDAVKERQYNRNSHAYKQILNAIDNNRISSKIPSSTQIQPTLTHLIKQNFLVLSTNYFRFAAELVKKIIMVNKDSINQRANILFNLQSSLLDLVIQQTDIAYQELALSRKDKHEEIYRETSLLKNTLTWKIGTAIVKPIKKIALCLSLWKR